MIHHLSRHVRRQDGYTLVEVIVSLAIGTFLMVGLTSVVLTSVQAAGTATSRVNASSQIRAFEYYAHDDFALGPVPVSCAATPPAQCLEIDGFQASNAAVPVASSDDVRYIWDGSSSLYRQVSGGTPSLIATNVTAFSWSVDGATPNSTCVVSITVTYGTYSESQVLRFYPRMQP